jgi:hypothetical protein
MNRKRKPNELKAWSTLKTRYKWLISSPAWVGIPLTLAVLYPEAILIGKLFGITTSEPANQNPNGALFMVAFCSAFVFTVLLAISFIYLLVILWLVTVDGYSLDDARAAMSSRTYPAHWVRNNSAVQ